MKRLLSLFLCLCLMLGMAPALAESTEAAAPQITTKSFPVYYESRDKTWREDFPLYFVDGAEDLPFVNLEDWTELLTYTYNQSNMSGKEATYALTLKVEEEGKKVLLTRENGFPLEVDFEAGTLSYMDYVAFTQPVGAGYMEITGFPETMNGEPYLMQRTQDRNLYGDVTVVDLKKYSIPMVAQDGKYLLPMQTLSAFTLTNLGVGVYYNGQAMFIKSIQTMTHPKNELETVLVQSGLLTPEVMQKYQAYEGTADEKLEYLLQIISEGSEKGKEIVDGYRKKLDNSLYIQYISVPKAPRSEALIKYGIRETALELDCFYGLKEAHNINNFLMFFMQNEVGNNLADADAAKADQAIADLTQYWFDDGHSAFVSASYLSETDAARNFGFSVKASSMLQLNLGTVRAQYPNAGLPYYEVGDTAYICFDNFILTLDETGFADYYALAKEGKMPEDTVGILYEAHKQITRENSPIKNVVLDLSMNGGGMAAAAFYTLGWFLGEANYSYRNTFTGAQTTHSFRVDLNLDHQFDENDTLAGRGLNLYCLISPKSFSCGNLVPWVFKESGTVTLLGKTSGGGSCVVGFNTTAWGASYRYSSPNRLAFVKNGAYYDVDKGVEPDHVIDDYTHFYDREALTEYIHGLY